MSLRFLLRGQMKYMRSRGIEVKMASADGPEIADIIAYEKVDHHTLKLTRKITPFQDLMAIFALRAWLVKENFDVVHSHTPKAGLVAMMSSWLARTPVRLHTVAGIPWMEATGMRRKLLKIVEKFTYRLATKVYFNSKGLSEFALENGLLKEGKLSVIANGSSNGIDTEFFSVDAIPSTEAELRKTYNIPQDAMVFCFVGRIVGDKGMNELAEAFSKLETENTNVHLLLVGPLEENLDPVASGSLKIFNNSEKIHMLGYQSDVRPYYKLSDVLVFPSYREGFPNVPMQAGAMGLPCIVSDINGCNEIIEDGENGLIIPPKDSTALLQAMTSLTSDHALFERLRGNARRMIEERYNQLLIWEEIESEYIELTKKRANV